MPTGCERVQTIGVRLELAGLAAVAEDPARKRTKMNGHQQRLMLYSAAVYNWLAGLILLPQTGIASALGFTPLMTHGPFDHIALAAIALLGIGYWMAAGNPVAHRGILILGVLGKLGFVAIMFGHHVLVGDVNLRQTVLALGDMVYVVLFVLVLKRLPRTQ
jgi:hypothetical protein